MVISVSFRFPCQSAMKMFQLADDLDNKMFNSGLFPACSICCVDPAPSGFQGSNCAAVILPFRSFLAKVSCGSSLWRTDPLLPRALATLFVYLPWMWNLGSHFHWPNLTDWVRNLVGFVVKAMPSQVSPLWQGSTIALPGHSSWLAASVSLRDSVACKMSKLKRDNGRSSARNEPEICQDQ